MDFEFDTEQSALGDAVGSLFAKAYDSEKRRAVAAADPGYSEKVWSQLAEMGVLGLPFTEEDGGVGAGPVEVAIVATEMGKVLAPEPFVEAMTAGGLIADCGTATQRTDLLAPLTEGSSLIVLAHAEPADRWSSSAHSVTAAAAGDSWTLSGVKEPVLHGARADVLLVSAVIDGGTQLFVVHGDAAGLERTGYRSFDGGRAARLSFDGVTAERLGDSDSDRTDALEKALTRARIAYCHEAVGAMQTALTTTSEYLKARKQFGVTLNRFQNLTFRAADMYVETELARSMALWATMVQDAGGDVVAAADRARRQISKAGRHVGQEAVQLHGGIGVTAEYSIGHYLSRLTALDHLLGDGDWALGRMASRVGTYDVVEALPG